MKYFDNEIEQCVLGCMIIDPSVIPNITNAVQETDFWNEFNRELYRAILNLVSAKKTPDIVTLNSETGSKDPVYVASITDIVPTAANWKYYTDKMKRLSMARDFSILLEECKLFDPENIETMLAKFTSESAKIAESSGGSDVRSARDFVLPMIESVEDAIKHRGTISGLDTGLNNLNDILDGIQSEYIVLGARASIGKTALAINIAKNMARKNIKVGYFSLEMSGKALMMRILSDLTGIEARALRNGFLSDSNAKRVCSIGLEMSNFPLYIVDNIRGDFDKILAKSRFMVRCLGVKILFIDHASLIRYSDQRMKRYEQFTCISNELQALQRELNIPIVVLAQLGRESEGKVPTLADLRESGSFEQDADTVVLLHRERAKEKEQTNIETDAIVAKNRNGACGRAELIFMPQYIRFVDKAKDQR